jgi:hypothetical protein
MGPFFVPEQQAEPVPSEDALGPPSGQLKQGSIAEDDPALAIELHGHKGEFIHEIAKPGLLHHNS